MKEIDSRWPVRNEKASWRLASLVRTENMSLVVDGLPARVRSVVVVARPAERLSATFYSQSEHIEVPQSAHRVTVRFPHGRPTSDHAAAYWILASPIHRAGI